MMGQTTLTPVQIQMAAAAGQKLLQRDDLMVPLELSKGGHLGVLEGLLGALARGEVIVTEPQREEPQEGPQLAAVPDAPDTE